MKKMNKEELIDFFIEKLGDNKVLGKVMTIDEIRAKLNAVIKDVKYEEPKKNGYLIGGWIPEKQIISLDSPILNYREMAEQNIVHEMLHALSQSYYSNGLMKCGLQINGQDYEGGRAINEGMTEALTYEILRLGFK